MFHWICPECGREIAPQAKECAACDPLAAAAAEASAVPVVKVSAEPVAVAAKPVVKEAQPPAPLQPLLLGAPKEPESAAPIPVQAARPEISPVVAKPATAKPPVLKQVVSEPEPLRASRIADARLRAPQPAPMPIQSHPAPDLFVGPQFSPSPASLPSLSAPVPGPRLAPLTDAARNAVSRLAPAKGNTEPAASRVEEQISLPGPTLPHELTSLHAAGIGKVLVAGQQEVASERRSSSWLLSFSVAAAVIAATLSAAFYAMPGLANSSAPPKKVATTKAKEIVDAPEPPAPVDPLARMVEVTGIRFVTDIPGQAPQIHYLVVNHGNLPLVGLTVHVTLRTSGTASESPLSQFAFRAPRLGPYESKEMVSSIERFNQPVTLPNWRNLRAEIQIAQ